MSNGSKKIPVKFSGSTGISNINLDSQFKQSEPYFNIPTTHQLQKAYTARYNQRMAILKHLKRYGSISTLQARQAGIMSPASRIKELREAGHIIKTVQDFESMNGMATYYLIKLAEPQQNEVKP